MAGLPIARALPMRRAREKTTPPRPLQISLPAELILNEEAGIDTKRQVYLVTLPHPRQARAATGEQLRAPGSLSKAAILSCFQDACQHPMYADAHSPEHLRSKKNDPEHLRSIYRFFMVFWTVFGTYFSIENIDLLYICSIEKIDLFYRYF